MESNAKIVIERFEYLADERTNLEDRWLDNFKKYHCYREYTEKEAEDIELGIKTDVKIPREFSYLETKKPRIINAIFSNRPIMKVNPLTKKAEEPSKNFEIMMQNDFSKYLYEPIYYAIDQAMMYGVGVFYMYWVLKDDLGEIIDRPGFGFKDIFNFYVPKNYPNIQKAPFVINRVIKLKSELEKRQRKSKDGKGYFNLDKLNKKQYEDNVTNARNMLSERFEVLDLGGTNYGSSKGNMHLEEVEVIECWTPEKIISVGNREILIRDEKNEAGFIPFWGIKSYPDATTFYSKGDIDYMMDGPKYATDVKNLRMDILKRVAHPGQLVSRNAQIDPADLIPKPYQIVYTYDMDGYREIIRPDVKQSIYNEESIAEANIEATLGIYSYMKGGYAPRGETARTTIEMKQAAFERMSTMTFFNSIVTFTDLAYKYLNYCKSKMNKERFFRYIDEEGNQIFKELSKEEINGEFEIVSNNINFKTLQSAESQNILVAAYDRLFRSGAVSLYDLNKMLLESLDIRGEHTILLKNEEQEIIKFLRENPESIEQMKGMIQQYMTMIQNRQNQQAIPGMQNMIKPGALTGAVPSELMGGQIPSRLIEGGEGSMEGMMGPEAEAILATGGNNPGGLQ